MFKGFTLLLWLALSVSTHLALQLHLKSGCPNWNCVGSCPIPFGIGLFLFGTVPFAFGLILGDQAVLMGTVLLFGLQAV